MEASIRPCQSTPDASDWLSIKYGWETSPISAVSQWNEIIEKAGRPEWVLISNVWGGLRDVRCGVSAVYYSLSLISCSQLWKTTLASTGPWLPTRLHLTSFYSLPHSSRIPGKKLKLTHSLQCLCFRMWLLHNILSEHMTKWWEWGWECTMHLSLYFLLIRDGKEILTVLCC